jgi:hypothetical protein
VRVAALRIGGEPERWRELGFDIDEGGLAMVGGVRLELDPAAKRGAINSWALDGDGVPDPVDGLPTDTASAGGAEAEHPNGVASIDHVVVMTPSLERTTAAFGEIGVECRRIREAGGGIRQGFFLVGGVLVEVIDGTGLEAEAPARFWGMTMVVADIDRAAELLGERLGSVKDAIQPGRRIATVRPEATDGMPLALITPRQ